MNQVAAQLFPEKDYSRPVAPLRSSGPGPGNPNPAAQDLCGPAPGTSWTAGLDIAFQPIVDIHTGRVFGFEALTRGVHALGFPSPIEFFDRCHDDGELAAVEEFILTQAFDKFVKIEGHKNLKLFVNLDGRTIAAETGIGSVLTALRDRYGLTNANVALEISERYDFSRAPRGLQCLLDLRAALGSLTLDDFGSGHANLQLFYHVEPAILKLDHFIISSIGSDPKKVVFLQHIVRMAHLLGSLVVAEGVETPQEYYVCRELGCDLVQGYAVARPTTQLKELELSYANIASLRNQDRRKAESDANLIMAQLDTVTPICVDENILTVFERFGIERERSFFPVVDSVGFPVGLVHEQDLKAIIYSMYGRELLRNKRRTAGSLASFVRPCTVANIDETTEQILEIFSSLPNSEGVLIVKESRFGGFLPARSLLKIINEKNLQLARDQNPLSRLPGNILIQDYLANAVADAGAAYHFAYLDFDYFKPFNDKYGFRTGDRAILMCADILRAMFGREGRFIGHVGGDDFFVGFRGTDGETALAEVCQALAKFKCDVESLYPTEDRSNGYISATSRTGEIQRFPLLTISGAIVHKPQDRPLPSMDNLSALIAEAKKAAKKSDDRIVRVCI
jgi:EAL domain-containing protein (putative c-di-GMP-specific phosphodiesterase class I)/GGDEF domain-containing protein